MDLTDNFLTYHHMAVSPHPLVSQEELQQLVEIPFLHEAYF